MLAVVHRSPSLLSAALGQRGIACAAAQVPDHMTPSQTRDVLLEMQPWTPREYNGLSRDFLAFGWSKGFLQIETQSQTQILGACEDETTITDHDIRGEKWPLAQTGQMLMEFVQCGYPEAPGFMAEFSSTRVEENPVPGRHLTKFPMFEMEFRGDFDDLLAFHHELLPATKVVRDATDIATITYKDAAKKLGVTVIENEHEAALPNLLGKDAVLLTEFPLHTDPYANMKQKVDADGEVVAQKCDILLKVDEEGNGMEVIGSAERETDVDLMMENFRTVRGGEFYKRLGAYNPAQLEYEMRLYGALPFIERVGFGSGGARWIRARRAAAERYGWELEE